MKATIKIPISKTQMELFCQTLLMDVTTQASQIDGKTCFHREIIARVLRRNDKTSPLYVAKKYNLLFTKGEAWWIWTECGYKMPELLNAVMMELHRQSL